MTSVLYIGGTGEISHACVGRSLEAGHHVTVLNRGRRSATLPDGVEAVVGDLRDEGAYDALDGRSFDVVCQFLAFEETRIERDAAAFAGRCGQYVFISSASAYRKPTNGDRITERTPLDNPHWTYSQHKAACERRLSALHESGRLPVTIVRPSHTYRTRFPAPIADGDHLARRLLDGKPVVVPGDGSSRWTLTHADDFATAFVWLLGAADAIGETFHITADDAFTWDEIVGCVAATLEVEADIVHVPVAEIVADRPDWSGPLVGDKANTMLFDNTKVEATTGWRSTTSLEAGLRSVRPHVLARLGNGYVADAAVDLAIDRLVAEGSNR